MAVAPLSAEIPRRILLTVDVPQQLSTRLVNQQIEMATSYLRFLLGRAMREQAHARAEARCARQDAVKAARLNASAKRAEAEEAAAVAAQIADDGISCVAG